MERRLTMLMRPLRVTAHLDSKVAAEDEIHLDALLHHVQAKRTISLDLSRASPAEAIQRVPLPLARIYGPDGRWVWAASAWDLAIDATAPTSPIHITRKKDVEDIEQRATTWTPSSGPERLQLLKRPGYEAPRITWTCIGSRREVRRALDCIENVGSVRRQDYGHVTRWEVEALGEDDTDAEALARLPFAYGRPARAMPWSWVDIERSESTSPSFGACLPPYWHPRAQEEIAAPSQAVTLLSDVRIVTDWALRC